MGFEFKDLEKAKNVLSETTGELFTRHFNLGKAHVIATLQSMMESGYGQCEINKMIAGMVDDMDDESKLYMLHLKSKMQEVKPGNSNG